MDNEVEDVKRTGRRKITQNHVLYLVKIWVCI